MLFNGSRLIGCPILSLHVGGRIASVSELIIDPDNLKIIGCRVEGPLVGKEVGEILPMESVREFSRLGMIVDSADEFVAPDEIIRIKNVIDLNFHLVGLKVESKQGAKLGKVSDFTVEPSGWQVQQLIVQRPLIKAFLDPELTIFVIASKKSMIIKLSSKRKPKLPNPRRRLPKMILCQVLSIRSANPILPPNHALKIKTKRNTLYVICIYVVHTMYIYYAVSS